MINWEKTGDFQRIEERGIYNRKQTYENKMLGSVIKKFQLLGRVDGDVELVAQARDEQGYQQLIQAIFKEPGFFSSSYSFKESLLLGREDFEEIVAQAKDAQGEYQQLMQEFIIESGFFLSSYFVDRPHKMVRFVNSDLEPIHGFIDAIEQVESYFTEIKQEVRNALVLKVALAPPITHSYGSRACEVDEREEAQANNTEEAQANNTEEAQANNREEVRVNNRDRRRLSK